MTNEQFEDLKQLIDARATATERYIDQRVEHLTTKDEIKELRAGIDGQFDTVLDAIGEKFEVVDTATEDHEKRLQRLEHRAA